MNKIIVNLVILLSSLFVTFNFNIDCLSNEEIEIVISLKGNSLYDYYNKSNVNSLSNFINSEEGNLYNEQISIYQDEVVKDLQKEYDINILSKSSILSNNIYLSVNESIIDDIKHIEIDSIEVQSKFESLSVEVEEEINQNGIYDYNLSDNTGAGMLIGILDTGINANHDAFSNMPDKDTAKYQDSSFLTNDLLNKTWAGIRYNSTNLYLNEKIVFAFNYSKFDLNVSGDNGSGYHGYHVAAIAAGNNGSDFYGASPDAQIAAFKVFDDYSTTASEYVVVMAIEDAIVLDCDVINMSIGSVSNYSESNSYSKIIENAKQSGVGVVVSNGNSSTSTSYGNNDYSSTDMLDYGAVNSPGNISSSFSVGNCNIEQTSMHKTSSWGALSNMEIKPDITAPGTNIYSAYANNQNKDNMYTSLSGTSMAAPNVAGILTNSIQYIEKNKNIFGELNDYERLCLAENMLMSTSNPIVYDDTFISPRHQGSGVASLVNLENTKVYLTGLNNSKPKITLGDDKNRTGIFEFEFYIYNVSDEKIIFELENNSSTENCIDDKLTLTPYKLSTITKYFIDDKEVANLEINAKSNLKLKVNLYLSSDDVEYIDNNFSNGSYVEGRILLSSNESNLTIPYVGFYGSWNESNAFSSNGTGKPMVDYNYKLNNNDFSYTLGNYNYSYDSTNFNEEELSFLDSNNDFRNSINVENIDEFTFDLTFRVIRQINNLSINVVDLSTNKVLVDSSESYLFYIKWHAESGGYHSYTINVDLEKVDLENNTNIGIVFSGELYSYSEEINQYIIPIVIDNEKPKLHKMSYLDNQLSFDISDNHLLQAYNIVSSNGEKLYEHYIPFLNFEDSFSVMSIDTSALEGELYLEVVDYAGNKSLFLLQDYDEFDNNYVVFIIVIVCVISVTSVLIIFKNKKKEVNV